MSCWLTVKKISSRYGIEEETLRNWASAGYITSTHVDDHLFLDEESFIGYLEAHKKKGLQADYLAKLIEEKKRECDFVIAQYDDALYLLKTWRGCEGLFKIIIYELAQLIAEPEKRDIFYAISMGEPIERVARRHHFTYDRVLQIHAALVKSLIQKKERTDAFRKQDMEYRSHCLPSYD